MGEILLADEVRDPLFDDEEGVALPLPVNISNTAAVTQMIYAIRKAEAVYERLELQDRESRAFYADQKRVCQSRVDAMKRAILGFLQSQGERNIKTPAGTAFQKTLAQHEWPADKLLLEWAEAAAPRVIRTKKEVDKRLLLQHIHSTGEVPEGFREWTDTRLEIR